MKFSVIIPTLNEGGEIVACLNKLRQFTEHSLQVIVVDGGSSDRTVELARPLADQVYVTSRGRAVQMNKGASCADGDVLLFLHVDTHLPEHAFALIADALTSRQWGRFDVRITGKARVLRVIACLMNFRSRLTGIATGDQAIFVTRSAFQQVGGYPPIALMEDIALSRALKRLSRPSSLYARVTTSGRRWEHYGPWRTIWLMWRMRFAYFLGVDPDRLAHRYGNSRPLT